MHIVYTCCNAKTTSVMTWVYIQRDKRARDRSTTTTQPKGGGLYSSVPYEQEKLVIITWLGWRWSRMSSELLRMRRTSSICSQKRVTSKTFVRASRPTFYLCASPKRQNIPKNACTNRSVLVIPHLLTCWGAIIAQPVINVGKRFDHKCNPHVPWDKTRDDSIQTTKPYRTTHSHPSRWCCRCCCYRMPCTAKIYVHLASPTGMLLLLLLGCWWGVGGVLVLCVWRRCIRGKKHEIKARNINVTLHIIIVLRPTPRTRHIKSRCRQPLLVPVHYNNNSSVSWQILWHCLRNVRIG